MSTFTILSSLLREAWLIDPSYAQAQLPLIQNLFAGNQLPAAELPALPEQLAYSLDGAEARSAGAYDSTGAGSVAVIDITGPVMKYDSCSSYGTQSYSRYIQQALDHPNIAAIVLRMDTPGGQVAGTATLADTIANRSKPILVHVTDGILASAGVWIAAPADKIYASQPTDGIGSIGVYTTLINPKGAYDAMGVEIIDIYADGSEDKNGSYRAAMAGDTSLMKQDLNFIRERFVATVQKHRPQVKETALTGKVFNAKKAQNEGLIDGIKSFQDVVNEAAALAANYKKPSKTGTKAETQTDTENMKFSFLPASVAALKGLDSEQITEENLAAANADFQAKVNDSLEIVQAGALEAMESEHAHTAAELATATEQLATATADLATATQALADANAEIETLKAARATAGATVIQAGPDKATTVERPLTSYEKKALGLK